MENSENQAIIQEMVSRIADKIKPEKVILFGSYARGTAGPDSDVDLLIVFPAIESRKQKKLEIYALLAGMGLPKDVVVATSDELRRFKDIPGTIIKPALSEGKIMYERAA